MADARFPGDFCLWSFVAHSLATLTHPEMKRHALYNPNPASLCDGERETKVCKAAGKGFASGEIECADVRRRPCSTAAYIGGGGWYEPMRWTSSVLPLCSADFLPYT
ncbi:hypothetical protein EXIGLDRAFT_723083 [Exidia glandulosa HHB12029]|uniref:Uncharacterized protein n=1 Tax=Exidia glandulosa HHB12029 TaxID=1314781 RepID=A0A165EYI7_EXIGL|nr:hypothetical protein EXIGLDRAFT_723083 [Exidia glandulosa HHB12029]